MFVCSFKHFDNKSVVPFPHALKTLLSETFPFNWQSLPFHKYPSLHCVYYASESWLLLRTALGYTHLPAECAGQPISYFAGHRLHLQVAELVLCVQQTPADQKNTVTDWMTVTFFFFICTSIQQLAISVSPGLIRVNSVQHGSGKLQVPAELLHVHNAMVHLLQDPLQPDKTNTYSCT